MSYVVRITGLVLLWVVAGPAFAWGHFGHETVGAIADTLIAGSNAEHQVQTILGTESLQQASLWADCARNVGDSPPNTYTSNPRFPECQQFELGTGVAEFEDYVRRNLTDCHPANGQETCHKQYHFADVAIERNSYDIADVGTSDHDVVHALLACIAVLKGQPSPAPFHIGSQKEALRLLAHFVGDVHQPLHVGAVYLSTTGHLVDPDHAGFSQNTATRGGNSLKRGTSNLHTEWDTIGTPLQVPAFKVAGVAAAAAVPVTASAVEDWPATWATETVLASQTAYQNLKYGKEVSPTSSNRHWPLTEPAGYSATRKALQKKQLVKAGARLAQVLQAIWP